MLKKIFSIQDYGETHYKITIFGIVIKQPKAKYAKLRKENPYYYYKKNKMDITKLPPAEGQVRDIQLANLILLKEMDYVCNQAGLKYWIDFGTLLGAVRHKGFIPWDDDVDTGMLREDHSKIIEAFEKYSRNPDIFAGLVRDKNDNFIVKVQHKKCPHLFVDIFPYDYYGAILSLKEQRKKTIEIKELRKKIQVQLKSKDNKEALRLIDKKRKDVIQRAKLVENSDLIWGIDFNHHWKNWFSSYDTIFPLKEIEFEDCKFPCINKIDAFLTGVYGDYMAYPKKFGVGHTMYAELSEEEKTEIERLKVQ